MGIFDKAKDMVAPSAPTVRSTEAGATGADFEPVAGVSLELYAEISKGLAAYNYDATKAPELAAAKGIAETDWNAAVEGWNARMTSNKAVAQRFNALYTGRT